MNASNQNNDFKTKQKKIKLFVKNYNITILHKCEGAVYVMLLY